MAAFFSFFLHKQTATNDNAIVKIHFGGLFLTPAKLLPFWVHVPSFLTCRVGHVASTNPLHTRTHAFIYLYLSRFLRSSLGQLSALRSLLWERTARRHVRTLLCSAMLCHAVVALGPQSVPIRTLIPL